MTCKKILLFCLFSSLSCAERVSISGPEEPEPAVKPPEAKSCLTHNVGGQDICVEQRVETFYVNQLESQAVDFLFVLDVSPSMGRVLERLGQAFSSLMSHIQSSRWRMFFTTADHGDHDYLENSNTGEKIFSQALMEDYHGTDPYFGHFMNLEYKGKTLDQIYLSPQTTDYVRVFQDTLTRNQEDSCSLAPYCQGAMEQPLRALKASLTRFKALVPPVEEPEQESGPKQGPEAEQESGPKQGPEAGPEPEPSSVISFIVTNEDERKEDPTQATTAQEVLDHFKALFPKKTFYSFGLLIQDDESEESQNCLQKQSQLESENHYSAVPGVRVSELARITGGKNISLCEEDFGPPLRDISRLLRRHIQSLSLKEEPLSKSVQLKFLKGKSQTRWKREGKKLVFEEVLPPDSEIKVSYFVKADKI